MVMEQTRMEKARFLAHEEEKEEPGSLWQALKSPRSERQRHIRQHVLLASNVCILLISIAFNVGTWRINNRGPELLPRCIHNTDMTDARPSIEYEERVFTGALLYDPDTKTAIRKPDAAVEYFGPPSKEIDDAWHELLHGRIKMRKVQLGT